MGLGYVLACIICTVVIFSAIDISSLAIASEDGNNSCQGIDKTGITLKIWLNVQGSTGIASSVLAILIVVIIVNSGSCNGDYSTCFKLLTVVTYILLGLFKFAWFIIGIIITARSHGNCVANGSDIGIMTVIALSFGVLGISSGCCLKMSAS